MNSPQTINGLMRHLRNHCNIKINGSYQKKQLVSYGYYHGYKGYRFIKNKHNQIPFTDFGEVVAVIEYDNNLKYKIAIQTFKIKKLSILKTVGSLSR